MVAHRGGKRNAWELGRIGRDPLRRSVSDFIGKDCTSHVRFNRSSSPASINRGHHPDPPYVLDFTCDKVYFGFLVSFTVLKFLKNCELSNSENMLMLRNGLAAPKQPVLCMFGYSLISCCQPGLTELRRCISSSLHP